MIEIRIERGIPVPPPSQPRDPNACVFCGRRERQGGYKTCDECREASKREFQDRVSQGMCGYFGCPNRQKLGRTQCPRHLDEMIAYSAARRAKRKQKKLCIDCGERPGWWGVRCVVCRTGYVKDPLPLGARKALRRHRRLEAIASRRYQAQQALALVTDARARQVLISRHGLADSVDRTLEEIGTALGVTRERIRQIENRALEEIAFYGVPVDLLRPPFKEIQRLPAYKRIISEESRKKSKAHQLVAEAIQRGEMAKQPCEKCGNQSAVAHHHDYDKPLEVEWLCRVHHMQAHGRGDGERRDAVKSRNWLDKITPSAEHYDAAAIVTAIRAAIYRPKLKNIALETGLSIPDARRILCGVPIRDDALIAMLRYVESLRNSD
jgi:hypothetical protein